MSDGPLQLFCYSPQRRAIEDILYPMLAPARVRVRGVEHSYQLEGIRCGTFVRISNMHSAPVPEQIMEALRVRGFTEWTIDDSAARERWGRT